MLLSESLIARPMESRSANSNSETTPDAPEDLDKADRHGNAQDCVQQAQKTLLVGTAALDRHLAARLEQMLQHGTEEHGADQQDRGEQGAAQGFLIVDPPRQSD